jgi:hypothetical protein
LQYNNTPGLGYFLTTQYTNNPNPNGYYDYYYSGSGWGSPWWSLDTIWYLYYYFLEDNNGNIKGYNGGAKYFAFMPLDQKRIHSIPNMVCFGCIIGSRQKIII